MATAFAQRIAELQRMEDDLDGILTPTASKPAEALIKEGYFKWTDGTKATVVVTNNGAKYLARWKSRGYVT